MWKKKSLSSRIFLYNSVWVATILFALRGIFPVTALSGSILSWVEIALLVVWIMVVLYLDQRRPEEPVKEKPLGKRIFLGAPLLLEIVLFEGYVAACMKNLEGTAKSSAVRMVFFIGILVCMVCYHDFSLIKSTVHDKQRKLYLWVSGIIGGVAFVYIYIFLVRMGVR